MAHTVNVEFKGDSQSSIKIANEGPNAAIGTVMDILTGHTNLDVDRIAALQLDLTGEDEL